MRERAREVGCARDVCCTVDIRRARHIKAVLGVNVTVEFNLAAGLRQCTRYRRGTRDARRTGNGVRAARRTNCRGASRVCVDIRCTLDGRCGIDRDSIRCTVVTKRGVAVNFQVAFCLRISSCYVHRELRATDRESGASNVNAILGIDIAAKLNLTAGLRKCSRYRRCSADVGRSVDVDD